LERKQNEFLETTAKLEQKLNDMRKQIVNATVKGTISVLTGSMNFNLLKKGWSLPTTGMVVLHQHMTLLLQRTKQMFSAS
jgi:hypothetical protein